MEYWSNAKIIGHIPNLPYVWLSSVLCNSKVYCTLVDGGMSGMEGTVSGYGWTYHCFVGYEGGTSDSEDGTTALSDVSGLRHPFPEFWLILQVKDDCVDMYYHSRSATTAQFNLCIQIMEGWQKLYDVSLVQYFSLQYLRKQLRILDRLKCVCLVLERLVWLRRVGIYWNRENSCLL